MDKITSKHLMFLIWGVTIVSIKTNLNIFLKDGGRDTWIAIIISSSLIFIYMIFSLRTIVQYGDSNLVSIYRKALGKVFGTIMLLPLGFNLFLTLLECSAVEANSMHTNMFLETPHWYLLIFFVIPAIYTIKKGLIPVVTVTIIGIVFAMLAGLNLVILTAKYKEYKYLLPIFGDGLSLSFLASILKSLGLYGSLMIVFPFIGFVDNKKTVVKYSIVALIFVIQMHIIAVTGAITSFGIERATRLIYPKLIQTQQINYFGFLESGEFFVMFQIIGGWFMKYTVSFFVIIQFLKDLKIYRWYLVHVISAVVFVLSYYISSNLFRLDIYLNIYCYASLLNFIIFPFIVLLVYKLRNRSQPLNS